MVPNGVILAVHWVAFFTAIKVSTVAIGLLGLRELSVVRAAARARDAWPADARAARSASAALVAFGLVLLVPEFTWESHTVRGLAWGVLSGFTFALMTVRTRKLAPDRWSSEMALWQNAIAALCVLPVVLWQGGLGGPVDMRARSARSLLLGVFCTALAHTLYIASLARLSAVDRGRVRGAGARLRNRARAVAAGRSPDARTIAGATLLVIAAIVASRRDAGRARRRDAVASRCSMAIHESASSACVPPLVARRLRIRGVSVFGCDAQDGRAIARACPAVAECRGARARARPRRASCGSTCRPVSRPSS